MITGSPSLGKITGNPASLQSALKGKTEILLVQGMGEPIVTFEQLVAAFPRITNKSKKFAKKILPLQASPGLAALVAALMTDGHVEWSTSDGRPRAKRIMLYSSNLDECHWFLRLVKRLFNVEGRVQAYTPNHDNWTKQPYRAFVCKAVVTNILILVGAPAGNKTEKKFLIPGWIMNGSRELKREFLRMFFTFEGSKPRQRPNSCSFQIDLCMVKKDELLSNGIQFLSQIGELLNGFGVKTCKIGYYAKRKGLKKANHVFHFSILKQTSITNFYRNIGYFNKEKQQLLEKAVLEISKFGRIRAKPVCVLISELKNVFGTDRMLAAEVSKFTERKYSNRQMEHYRRKESSVPLEIVFTLIKIKKEKAILRELPDYVKFLYDLNPNALSFP